MQWRISTAGLALYASIGTNNQAWKRQIENTDSNTTASKIFVG
jgi:hypothetical protein